MKKLDKKIKSLCVVTAVAATSALAGTNGNPVQQASGEVTTNATVELKSREMFPRAPVFRDVVRVYETNLVWAATGEPIYFMRNKVHQTSTDKLFSVLDHKFEQFVEDRLDCGDICERKGTATTSYTFDKPNNKYAWKRHRSFKQKIIFEGELKDFPGIDLKAGRVLSDISGVTNGWDSTESYTPGIVHTHTLQNIINEEEKRYLSTETDTRTDERKPGVKKVKVGVDVLETKQDAFPMTLNDVRSRASYKVIDLGNGKVRIVGKQSGRNIELNETQCRVLSDYKKVKKGKINLPFPSSVKKEGYREHQNLKKVKSYEQTMAKHFGEKTRSDS